ncbi:hypothetical protein PHLCEN_2v247 [Hermanssonia centrifuga]|uniref:Cytochrome P450 n=1 Tax=Hermanssonia centrifuga TaxID=98765 RepID=A0A2R6S6L8_9APHY|nr:hypothetical protein PHLCEN_2v247 [Hermanssonia centrifuga]
MPPGPDGLPYLGNILQLTKTHWLRFSEWSEQYGGYEKHPGYLRLMTPPSTFRWRRFRRAAHEGFAGKSSLVYQPLQEKHAILLVSRIFQDLEGWDAELMRFAFISFTPETNNSIFGKCSACSVLSACYGWTVLDSTADDLIQRINDIPQRIGGPITSRPAAGMVQFFPWMLYLPEWLAKWKRRCRELHESDTKMLESFLDDFEKKPVCQWGHPSLG